MIGLVVGCAAMAGADTGNCTKSEVLTLARSGYSASEIQGLCTELTASPNCCCGEVYGISKGPITRGLVDYELRNGGRVYFVWSDADTCGLANNSLCVETSYCGRN